LSDIVERLREIANWPQPDQGEREMRSLHGDDVLACVRALFEAADEIVRLRAENNRLRDALEKIDGTLTNMQPVIANGLLDKHQLDYVDRYVDPAVQTGRAALKGDTP
jgi:hypothetical protein